MIDRLLIANTNHHFTSGNKLMNAQNTERILIDRTKLNKNLNSKEMRKVSQEKIDLIKKLPPKHFKNYKSLKFNPENKVNLVERMQQRYNIMLELPAKKIQAKHER